MPLKAQKFYKRSMITKTTSETLRLNNFIDDSYQIITNSTQSVQHIYKRSNYNPYNVSNSNNSFEITGVSITKSGFDDGSSDDLEKSYSTDDSIYNSTNSNTRSICDYSADSVISELLYETATQNFGAFIENTVNNDECNNDNQQSVEQLSPNQISYSRGRWKCYDLSNDDSIKNDDLITSENNQSTANHESFISTGNSEEHRIIADIDHIDLHSKDYCKPGQSSQVVEISGPSSCNIDKKIENALDTVKTHLMTAIHKEVDVLKSKVSLLEGRVNELEVENSMLRINYSSSFQL